MLNLATWHHTNKGYWRWLFGKSRNMSSLPPNKPNIPLCYLAMHAVCMKCVYHTSTYTHTHTTRSANDVLSCCVCRSWCPVFLFAKTELWLIRLWLIRLWFVMQECVPTNAGHPLLLAKNQHACNDVMTCAINWLIDAWQVGFVGVNDDVLWKRWKSCTVVYGSSKWS